MTFDDDMAYLQFDGGLKIVPISALGLSWPPPEKIEVAGFPMQRTRLSSLTDEQRKGMTHVCRAAEYKPSNDIGER